MLLSEYSKMALNAISYYTALLWNVKLQTLGSMSLHKPSTVHLNILLDLEELKKLITLPSTISNLTQTLKSACLLEMYYLANTEIVLAKLRHRIRIT